MLVLGGSPMPCFSQGRVAIKLGLEHGQDFRLAKDRAMARCLFKRLKPEHAWFAWPCTPFCAWMKLAVLRNCNVAPRLKEGRVHLRFSLQLAHSQRASGRQAHCENPLTSTAWREPAATQEFSQPQWHWTRLDQCTTGLVGPQGDLHLKPTLIRTTDAALRDALSLRCPADHPHELVQGAATAASAMYSPRLAKLAADILCRSTPLVRVGGGDGAVLLQKCRYKSWQGGRGAFRARPPAMVPTVERVRGSAAPV